MIATATQEPTYESVKKLIKKLCNRKHCQRCTFDDRLSVANEAYAKSHTDWKPERSSFSTHIHNRVRFALLTECKKCKQQKIKYAHYNTNQIQAKEKLGFWGTLGELSEDAHVVANLLIETPGELVKLRNSRRKGLRFLRSCLYELGWGIERIRESFSEIRRALK